MFVLMFHLGNQVDLNVPNFTLSTSEPISRQKRRKSIVENIPPISMDNNEAYMLKVQTKRY